MVNPKLQELVGFRGRGGGGGGMGGGRGSGGEGRYGGMLCFFTTFYPDDY